MSLLGWTIAKYGTGLPVAVVSPSLAETNTECFESALKNAPGDDVRKRSRSLGEEERRGEKSNKRAAELPRSIAQRAEGRLRD